MVLCMKTTIELPDGLLIAAKKRAAEERRPLRALIEDGLHHVLRTRPGPAARKLKWVTSAGGLPPDLDLADRSGMHDWLRRHGT